MKREINLTSEQVKAILSEAKKNSLRDYLLLKTMTVGDFRVGEVVGSEARRWVKSDRTWTPAEPSLRGLQIQDLHDDGVWVEGKGWKKEKNPAPPAKVPLPLELVKELREFTGTRKNGRIFEISESRVEQMTRFYAKRAGVIDWKLVHPHRFRHFTTTQIARKHGVVAARDIARHRNVSTTNRYISELPEEEKRKIIEAQEDLIS
jgi:site-specific recombinase XerC